MRLSYLLLDLDDTLYPSSSGFHHEIDRRMTDFVCRFLGIPPEEANIRRKGYVERYGTTLKGLLTDHNLSAADEFLDYVHPVNLEDFIAADPALRAALASIPLPKSVLTNSPREHAFRVLNFLGIRDLFEHVFDLRFNGFEGKPVERAYTRALEVIGRRAEEVLFLDDRPAYLNAFRELGGQVLLVAEDEDAAAEAPGIARIRSILDLPAWLEDLSRNDTPSAVWS